MSVEGSVGATGVHAGIARRLGGWLIDAAAKSVLAVMVASSYCIFHPAFWLWLLLVPFLLQWAFNALGRSPGMQLFGLKIVNQAAEPPGVWGGLKRTVGALPSVLTLGLGHYWAIWDGQHSTWHDRLAGTSVVRRQTGGVPRGADGGSAEGARTERVTASRSGPAHADSTPTGAVGTRASVGRVLRWASGAARLRGHAFEAVAGSPGSFWYAGAIAGLIGLAFWIGELAPVTTAGFTSDPEPVLPRDQATLSGPIAAFATVALSAAIAVPSLIGWLVASQVFHRGTGADRRGRSLRASASVVGFALVPALFLAIGLGPIFRVVSWAVVAVWSLLTLGAAARAVDGRSRMRPIPVALITLAAFVLGAILAGVLLFALFVLISLFGWLFTSGF